MDAGVNTIDARAVGIGNKLDNDMVRMGENASRAQDELRQIIETRLDAAASKHASTAMESRQEVLANFELLNGGVKETLGQLGAQQKERLDNVALLLAISRRPRSARRYLLEAASNSD